MNTPPLHIICEKDVGLFSLIQQVIGHIPIAISEGRVPIAYFGDSCCYWLEEGYREKRNVWEYYFEPIVHDSSSAHIPSEVKDFIAENPLDHTKAGYMIGETVFVSNHFGDHPDFKDKSLKIPYTWKDPGQGIRNKASKIIDEYVRPRAYITQQVENFYHDQMIGNFVIGVHIRGTDVTDKKEHNLHRRGSFNLKEYQKKISEILDTVTGSKIYVATDSQQALDYMKSTYPERVIHFSSIFHQTGSVTGKGPNGWGIPGYLANDSEKAAENGEEAVIDYILLSKCQFMVHNGSGIPRTALLKNPDLKHFNIHNKNKFIKNLFLIYNLEFFHVIKIILKKYMISVYHALKRLFSKH